MGATRQEMIELRLLQAAQTRAATDEATAEEYADVLRAGEELPSADVFLDPAGNRWLADGHIRRRAHEIAERHSMWCRVHDGTRRDAMLFGIEANHKHGLRPSPDDRRRAVAILLEDPEWSKWSDAEIARKVSGCENSGAAQQMVRETREKLSSLAAKMRDQGGGAGGQEGRKVSRGGATYDMKTGNIGGGKGQGDEDDRGGGTRQKRDESSDAWLRHCLEELERAREAATRVEGGGELVLALDLARGIATRLAAGEGE